MGGFQVSINTDVFKLRVYLRRDDIKLDVGEMMRC